MSCLFVFVASSGSRLAFAQPAEITAVERWRMTYDYVETAANQTSLAEWSHSIAATGTVTLVKQDRNTWTGTPSVRVHYRFDGTFDNGNMCISETHIDTIALAESLAESATLNVFGAGYQIALGNPSVAVEVRQNVACEPELVTSTESRNWSEYILDEFAYPPSGTTLEGTYQAEARVSPELPTVETDPHPSSLVVRYRIVPEVVEDLTLEIDDSGPYVDWRPTAEKDGSGGEALTVRARVVSSTGREPTARVLRFAWKLSGTSREPGIAMNFPASAQDSDFDLRFEVDDRDRAIVTNMGQDLERLVTSGFEDSARVVPYDWGGWSMLEVTAHLDDGRTLTGKAKLAGTDGLRLPKRAEGSLIADAWKTKWGARGADDADDENDPPGDGTRGDGFTLYQEYRGFYENGKQISAEPLLKDLFVLTPDAARPGVVKFARISGLRVRHRLQEDEFPFNRVMNANRREGPTRSPQTGLQVIIASGPVRREAASGVIVGQAVGGPGNPKKIFELFLPADWALLTPSLRYHVVAHELLHGVNVYHHGETDQIALWDLDQDGEVAETTQAGETKIRVYREVDHDVTENYVAFLENARKPLVIWRGAEGGQHSGADDCVMRYWVSQAYMGQPDVTRRYAVKEEAGQELCRSPRGAGVNGMRAPQSRYGDASPMRGNCLGQILVNDAVEPPLR